MKELSSKNIVVEKPLNFDANLEKLRSLPFSESNPYPYIAAGLATHLLNRSSPAYPSARMKIKGPPDLEMYVKFMAQVREANIEEPLKETILETLDYPLRRGFMPDFIYRAESTEVLNSIISTGYRIAYDYPPINPLIAQVAKTQPDSAPIPIKIASASKSPMKFVWLEFEAKNPEIQLPFNWKLTAHLVRNLYPNQVRNIAQRLDINHNFITDEVLLAYNYLYAYELALQHPASRRISAEFHHNATELALNQLKFMAGSLFRKAFEVERETVDRSEFQVFLQKYNIDETERNYILMAYNLALSAHRGLKRKSGEPYFSHLRETALILLRAGIRSPLIIAAALVHDLTEDTMYLAKRGGIDPNDPAKIMYDRLNTIFGSRFARVIEDVTEREMILDTMYNPYSDLPKKDVQAEYRDRFRNRLVLPESMLIKMADRLHNLRTLSFMEESKQIDKLIETVNYFLPAFRMPLSNLTNDYVPASFERARVIMLRQIEKEIQRLQVELGVVITEPEVEFDSIVMKLVNEMNNDMA